MHKEKILKLKYFIKNRFRKIHSKFFVNKSFIEFQLYLLYAGAIDVLSVIYDGDERISIVGSDGGGDNSFLTYFRQSLHCFARASIVDLVS